MMEHVHTFNKTLDVVFLALQTAVVLFLLLHDWIPLGRLNNNAAKSREDSPLHLLTTTLVAAVPAGVGLFYCARYFSRAYPGWLDTLLWITYGLFLIGMLRAWWIPYLLIPDAKRAERYQTIFAGTHAFLPRRNGIVPDTLHVLLHVAAVCTLLLLCVRDFAG
jgi:hypothetical protein